MTRAELFDIVKANIRTAMPRTRGLPIPETTSIRELGGHSIEAVAMLSLTLTQLGIEVPVDRCLRTSNLAGLLDLLEAELRRR